MKLFKKFAAITLCIALLLSLLACGKDTGSADTDGEGGTESGSSANAIGYPALIDCAETSGNIKNVILIIGDGMGEAHLDAGELFGGVEFAFRDELSKFYSETNSLDKKGEATEVTDSAASATAMATGHLTVNKSAGMDAKMNYLSTILDLAKEYNKSTGVITTDYLTGATPAGFTAHTNNRNLENKVIQSQIDCGVDLMIGQYYDLYNDYSEQISKNYGFFTEYDREGILADKTKDAFCHFEIETEAESSVKLSEVTDLAIEYLSADEDGFVLVVEQAHIDKHSHNKELEGSAKAAVSLNETVSLALAYAKEVGNTAVIVTADHETCGLAVSTDPEELPKKAPTPSGAEFSYEYKAAYHTDTPVPVFVFGFVARPELCPTYKSAERIKNSEIFSFIQDLVVNS